MERRKHGLDKASDTRETLWMVQRIAHYVFDFCHNFGIHFRYPWHLFAGFRAALLPSWAAQVAEGVFKSVKNHFKGCEMVLKWSIPEANKKSLTSASDPKWGAFL